MAAFEISIPEWGNRPGGATVVDLAPVRESGLVLASRDGHPLAATLFQPARDNGVVVQLNSAYAVPRAHYAAYARFLAGQGFVVLTWDYRGIGGSRVRSWSGSRYRLQHWGERDVAAVADWLAGRFPGRRLVAVGHSAGGQLVGLADNVHRFDGLLAIASQSGYWRLFDPPYDLLALAWFYAVVPAVAVLGTVLPGLRRGGFDAPPGVALQWARWGRNPHYISDDAGRPVREHFERYGGWVRLVHITDDLEYAPRRAVEALAGFFRNARTEVVHRSPQDWGVDRVGHFGFFRPSMPRAAWQETAQWLRAAAAAPETLPAREEQS